MKTTRAIAVIALAGLSHAASAQVTLHLDATQTFVAYGTVNWTVSVTGLTANQFVQAYDLNFIASGNYATITPFSDALTPLVNPEPGTPTDASIIGANGGQSTTLNPIGTQFGDVVLGTFTTVKTSLDWLSYDIADGGVLNAPLIRIRTGSDFGPIAFEGKPIVLSDRVGIPAPHTAALLALGALPLTRRRRN